MLPIVESLLPGLPVHELVIMFEGVFWEQVRSGERQKGPGSKEECSKVSKRRKEIMLCRKKSFLLDV